MTKLIVSKASLDDVKDIVEVYCSSIKEWFKYVNDRRVQARYEDLSVSERFDHGGPWMSIETCSVHINYLLTSGQYPLIAILNDKVIGELELYVGYERGVLGKCGFIDALEVHNNFRRRGIGRRLVYEAMKISEDLGCDTIAVWPNPEAIDFYKRCGISDVAYRVVYVEMSIPPDINAVNPSDLSLKEFPNNYDLIRDWAFISPRIESSFTAWIKSRWDYAIEEEIMKSFESLVPNLNAAIIIESLWRDRSRAKVSLWLKSVDNLEDVIELIMKIVKYMEFKYIRLLVTKEIYHKYLTKYKCRVIDEYLVLYKRLK